MGNPELVIIAPNLPTPAYGLTGIPTWIIPPHRRPLRVGAGPPSGHAELQQPALSEHPETSKARTPAPSPSANLGCYAAKAPLSRPRRFPGARCRSRQNSTEVLDELRCESLAERAACLGLHRGSRSKLSVAGGTARPPWGLLYTPKAHRSCPCPPHCYFAEVIPLDGPPLRKPRSRAMNASSMCGTSAMASTASP